MYSDGDKKKAGGCGDISDAIAAWQSWPASWISHHGDPCCTLAREWVLAMDYAQLHTGNLRSGPRWLRQRHQWGASPWPIHWCEAVERKTLDCGALAAITHEIYGARGLRSFPLQLVQRYTPDAARQWYRRWEGDRSSVRWIAGSLIYHEGCAVVMGEHEIGIWDPSAASWVNPPQCDGYGATVAVRVTVPDGDSPTSFTWGSHEVPANRWHELVGTRATAF